MSETKPPAAAAPETLSQRSVIIRPWPKVVFLYPTLLCSLVCWFAQLLQGSETGAGGAAVEIGSRALGNTFLALFFLNLLVFAFDFSRIKSITLVVVLVALGLGLGWADATWGIAESGLAGPTGGRSGAPAGRTTLAVAGPVSRTAVIETGIADRGENMSRFATEALTYLRDAIREAS